MGEERAKGAGMSDAFRYDAVRVDGGGYYVPERWTRELRLTLWERDFWSRPVRSVFDDPGETPAQTGHDS